MPTERGPPYRSTLARIATGSCAPNTAGGSCRGNGSISTSEATPSTSHRPSYDQADLLHASTAEEEEGRLHRERLNRANPGKMLPPLPARSPPGGSGAWSGRESEGIGRCANIRS